MEIGRIAARLAPSNAGDVAAVEVTDLAYDARDVRPGSLFFCVPGTRADGHDFAGDAVARGAVALVVERALGLGLPELVVADARAAMAAAADEFFGRPTESLRVAGVTGTNGKTTSAYLLYSVLREAGLRPGLLGTIESRIGGESRPALRTTPEAIDLQRSFRELLDAGDQSCAMEATSHGSELKRLDHVRFAVLVFTNLTQDHLDFHGTMEHYFQAKRRLFVEADPPPAAAVNVGDPYGRRLADELRSLDRAPLLTYGWAGDARPADMTAPVADVHLDVSFGAIDDDSLCINGLYFQPRLVGDFNVENIMGVVAASRLLGLPDDAIVAGIDSLQGVPGRFEAVDEGQPFTVVVDYAHTPDSLANVLKAARSLARRRVICVFGCGGDRDRSKRPVMGQVASELADVAIATSDNPRSEDPLAIIEEIAAGAVELEVEPDRREAIARAIELAEPGDVVVIAGKGHEQGQEFADRTLPFDDREVAREALRRLGAAA